MKSTNSNTKSIFICSICQRTYTSQLPYKKHIKTKHANQNFNVNVKPKTISEKPNAKRGRPQKQKEKVIQNDKLLYKFVENSNLKRRRAAENDLIASCGELGLILHDYLGETKKTHNGLLMAPYERPSKVQILYDKVCKNPIFIKKLLDIHSKDQLMALEIKCIDTSFLEDQNLNAYEVMIAILIYLSKLFKEDYLKEIIAIFIGFIYYMNEKGIDAKQKTCWGYLKDYGDNHWEVYTSKEYIKDTTYNEFRLLNKSSYSKAMQANITKECNDYEENCKYWYNGSFTIRFLEKIYDLLHAYGISNPEWSLL